MKILVLIVSFGTHQNMYLKQMIDTFKNINKHRLDIKIFCTDIYDDKLDVEYIKFENNIGINLSLQPYLYIKQHQDYIFKSYEYVIYSENDILISESNIDNFILWNEKLTSHNCCCGFIRYENKDDTVYAVDFIHSIGGYEIIDDIRYAQTYDNVHSGCWMFTVSQLNNIITHIPGSIGHSLEDRASNVYNSSRWPGSGWGIKKLIPVYDVNKLLVHHMTNKYVVDLNTPHGKLRIEDLVS